MNITKELAHKYLMNNDSIFYNTIGFREFLVTDISYDVNNNLLIIEYEFIIQRPDSLNSSSIYICNTKFSNWVLKNRKFRLNKILE